MRIIETVYMVTAMEGIACVDDVDPRNTSSARGTLGVHS